MKAINNLCNESYKQLMQWKLWTTYAMKAIWTTYAMKAIWTTYAMKAINN